MNIDELEALAKRHGATSYRNRADTANPAFGFNVSGLQSLINELQARDTALIQKMLDAFTSTLEGKALHALHMSAINAAYARLYKTGGQHVD